MLNLSNVERVEARPLSIHRQGPSSEASNLLLDLTPGEALLFSSDSDKEHKASQRAVNIVMNKIKKSHPDYNFVTRTVSSDKDEFILGVYRVDDAVAA
jgi:hypothetical protein